MKIVFLILLCLPTLAQTRIQAADAEKFIGQTCTVSGYVVHVKIIETSNIRMAFLDFEQKYPNNPFKVTIFGNEFHRFPKDLDKLYQNKKIQITGTIDTDTYGTPQIIAHSPDDLLIVE
ncbi:MAG: hypothetical protein NW226_02185 [Microscillaceae bacterium]|nr:hypothetical protein [Microscillaceae bacterium]